MKVFVFLSSVFFIAVTVGHSPAIAQTTAREFVAAGQYDQARNAVLNAAKDSKHIALYLAYLEGLIATHQRHPERAMDVFRKILQVAPDFAPARRELSALLIVGGHQDAALYHAEQLLKQSPDGPQKDQLRNFILMHSSTKPFGVSLRFSILPSSNVTNGTADHKVLVGDTEFEVDAQSRQQRGVGLGMGGTMWNTWRVSETLNASASLSLDNKIWSRALPDELSAVGRLRLSHVSQTIGYSFGPYVGRLYSDGKLKRVQTGFFTDIRGMVSRQNLAFASLSHALQSYPDQSYRDGKLTSGQIGLQLTRPGNQSLTFFIPFKKETTNRAHLNHNMVGAQVSFQKTWGRKFETTFAVSIEKSSYDGAFPGTNVIRQDSLRRLSMSIGHDKIQFGKYTPELRLGYGVNKSNIGLFNYTSQDIGINFSKRF